MKKEMWEMKQADSADSLDVLIYGDVEETDFWTGEQSENSSKHFAKSLADAGDIKQINVFINSYGGSVNEGTAIYNQLKRHKAKKTVYVDGFACSVASIIAMAGDEVVMPKNAMMMVHNPWTIAAGNAKELRKVADDLEKIGESGKQAYLMKADGKLEEKQLDKMLDEETWLTAGECVEYGLADRIEDEAIDVEEKSKVIPDDVKQKCKFNLFQVMKMNKCSDSDKKENVCETEEKIQKSKEGKQSTILEKLQQKEKKNEVK